MTRVAAQLAGNAIERIRAEMHLRETLERLNLAETVAQIRNLGMQLPKRHHDSFGGTGP